MSESITMAGGAELDAMLKELPGKVQKKLMRHALRAGAKVVADAARARCPVSTDPSDQHPGQLRKSIKVRAKKSRSRDEVGVQVVTGEGDFIGNAFYAPMVEYGHMAGDQKLGDTRRMVPAHPFMRPAIDETKGEVVGVIADDLRHGLEEETKQ